jgi:hypothetical protein
MKTKVLMVVVVVVVLFASAALAGPIDWLAGKTGYISEKNFEQLKASKDAEIEELKASKDAEIEKLKASKDAEIEKLKASKDAEIKRLKEEIQEISQIQKLNKIMIPITILISMLLGLWLGRLKIKATQVAANK